MDCETIIKKLPEHMDSLLPKDEAALMTEHLASCAECRGEYEELLKTVAHMKDLEELDPPDWLTSKVMAKVKEDASKTTRGWKAIFRPLSVKLPLGAAATVLIAMAALYIYRANQSATTILPMRHPETLEQRAGEGNGSQHVVPGEATKPQETKKRKTPVALPQEAPTRTSTLRSTDEEPLKAAVAEGWGTTGNVPSPPTPSGEPEARPAPSEEGGNKPAPTARGSIASPAPPSEKAEVKDTDLAEEATNRSATIAEITASDPRLKDLLEKEIRERLDTISTCYEKGSGKVDVAFVITAEGSTQKQRVVKDGTGEETGTQCLVKEIKTWRFSFGGVKVAATFDIRQ